MSEKISLVMGASGFLGSHIIKQLSAQNQPVRAFVRESSNTQTIDDLNISTYRGDIMDPASLRQAISECDVIYYCIVDTRAWLKDTSPLFRTNVDGLRNVLEVAAEVGVDKFIYTSSIVTIGLNPSGIATEKDDFNWVNKAPAYVRCRVDAENLMFEFCNNRGLPGIAMCVANTYGPGDSQPTPHGALIKNVALEETSLPIDCCNPIVDIRDAAQAMILAADKGAVGERYIISAEHLNQITLFGYAADAAGVKHPRLKLSIPVVYIIALVAQTVNKLFGKRTALNTESILLSHIFNEMDCSKARQQLGWQPRPMKQSIEDAVAFYLAE